MMVLLRRIKGFNPIRFIMKYSGYAILSLFALLIGLSGCATYNAQKVGPTPIMQANAEIP